VEDTSGLGLKRIGCHLLEFLVQGLQDGVVNIICDAEVDGVDVGGFSLTMAEGNVNVWWNFDVLDWGKLIRWVRCGG
jgi:hypothetical protein